MYVPCLWELYYCVSLAIRRVECVKCAEGVWCSCWCIARGYVGAGVLLGWKRFTLHTLGCWWSAVRSRAASGMREIVRLNLSCGACVGWMTSSKRGRIILRWVVTKYCTCECVLDSSLCGREIVAVMNLKVLSQVENFSTCSGCISWSSCLRLGVRSWVRKLRPAASFYPSRQRFINLLNPFVITSQQTWE